MNVYVNDSLRADILIETGGDFSVENSHTATSNIRLSIPSESSPLQECDYVELKNDENQILYAGTVMQITQDTFSNHTLSFKCYSVLLSDNSELLASVFVDMSFSPGANMMQILFGNQPDSEWYNSSLPVFYGLVPGRMESEGISPGTVDDFSRFVLSEPANLWGMYIRDALDTLCEIAGAWWSVTPDKVFHMRYNGVSYPAPFDIDENAEVFDVSVSKDAFTLYSAVRVVGGIGPGGQQNIQITPEDSISDGAAIVSDTRLQTLYPIHSIPDGTLFIELVKTHDVLYLSVGAKGISEDKDAYYTSGDNMIEIDPEHTTARFPTPWSTDIVHLSYIPDVRVYCRIIDDELVKEIAAQRGGSGIIEQVIEDSSIISYDDAVSMAAGYLEEAKRRAASISFSTFSGNWAVGQTLDVDLPYYNISGGYNIVSVAREPIVKQGDNVVIKTNVTASNVPLRQKSGVLFYSPKSIAFTIGTDFPNTKSLYFNNAVRLSSTVIIRKTVYSLWEDVSGKTWQYYSDYSWGDFSVISQIQLGPIQGLENQGKTAWAQQIYSPDGSPAPNIDLIGTLYVVGETQSVSIQAQTSSLDEATGLTGTYWIDMDDCPFQITSLEFRYNGNVLWTAPVSIDKSPENSDGDFSLSLTITHHACGQYLTSGGEYQMLYPLYSGHTIDPFISDNGLQIDEESAGAVYTRIPSASMPDITNGSFQLTHILYENELNTFIESAAYVEGTGVESLVYIMQFPINEDHSGNGIDGKYQLNIIINTNLT